MQQILDNGSVNGNSPGNLIVRPLFETFPAKVIFTIPVIKPDTAAYAQRRADIFDLLRTGPAEKSMIFSMAQVHRAIQTLWRKKQFQTSLNQ